MPIPIPIVQNCFFSRDFTSWASLFLLTGPSWNRWPTIGPTSYTFPTSQTPSSKLAPRQTHRKTCVHMKLHAISFGVSTRKFEIQFVWDSGVLSQCVLLFVVCSCLHYQLHVQRCVIILFVLQPLQPFWRSPGLPELRVLYRIVVTFTPERLTQLPDRSLLCKHFTSGSCHGVNFFSHPSRGSPFFGWAQTLWQSLLRKRTIETSVPCSLCEPDIVE
jgi:hypothetical protein